MDKEKGFDEIAAVKADYKEWPEITECIPKRNSYYYGFLSGADDSTKKLADKNYGNIEQTVREFAENEVKPLIDELVELLFNDNESTCKVDNCEKGSDIPCGCSICVEENKQFWKNKIDFLIKERFGGEV